MGMIHHILSWRKVQIEKQPEGIKSVCVLIPIFSFQFLCSLNLLCFYSHPQSFQLLICPLEHPVYVQQAPQNPKPVFLHQYYCALESSGYLVKMQILMQYV